MKTLNYAFVFFICAIISAVVGFRLDILSFKVIFYVFLTLCFVALVAGSLRKEDGWEDE